MGSAAPPWANVPTGEAKNSATRPAWPSVLICSTHGVTRQQDAETRVSAYRNLYQWFDLKRTMFLDVGQFRGLRALHPCRGEEIIEGLRNLVLESRHRGACAQH